MKLGERIYISGYNLEKGVVTKRLGGLHGSFTFILLQKLRNGNIIMLTANVKGLEFFWAVKLVKEFQTECSLDNFLFEMFCILPFVYFWVLYISPVVNFPLRYGQRLYSDLQDTPKAAFA